MTGKRQRGVALISVLFLVVILTLLVSQLLTQGWQDIERTQWLNEQAQAYQYAIAGEQMTRQLLHRDFEELKAKQLTHTPVPGPVRHFRPDNGDIIVQLIDLQGRINLNNLLQDDYAELPRRFLTEVMQQPSLIPLLADWLDGDFVTRAGGAEDDYYLSQQMPLRTANRPLGHPSEISIFGQSGMAGTLEYNRWLTALDKPTALNINSMEPQLATLLNPQLSPAQLETIRATTPFNSLEELLQSEMTAGLAINTAHLTVTSSYYQADVYARFHNWLQPLRSRFTLDPITGEIDLLDRQLVSPDNTAAYLSLLKQEDPDDSDITF
jgi:general secretion pathway protein K